MEEDRLFSDFRLERQRASRDLEAELSVEWRNYVETLTEEFKAEMKKQQQQQQQRGSSAAAAASAYGKKGDKNEIESQFQKRKNEGELRWNF